MKINERVLENLIFSLAILILVVSVVFNAPYFIYLTVFILVTLIVTEIHSINN